MVYIDAEGNFAFLAAVGIGAGIGGLISGVAKVIDNVRHDKDWHDGLGKAVLSGAVSGAVTAIPIPGVGPLASATITGAVSNLAVDAINGDINSFKDAALSLTEGAVTGAVSHGVGKYIKKAKSSLSNEELVQKAATLAERKIGGTGKVAGTQKHAYAKKLIDRYQNIYGDRGLKTETSWINRRSVPYGTRGSTRIDVLDTVNKCAYDYKFTQYPGKGLGQKQINRILTNGPSYIKSVKEINP